MKRISTFLAVVALLVSSNILIAGEQYTINHEASNMEWIGRKVLGSHNGTVDIKSGHLHSDGKTISGGEFVIDMTAIKNEDLKEDGAAKLVGHLESEDFFNVAEYPEATLSIKNVEAYDGDEDASHWVTADLTIKGITNEILFPATIVHKGNKLYADANFKIDRTLWDVRYGSGKFFNGLGDNTISDDIEFTLALVLTR